MVNSRRNLNLGIDQPYKLENTQGNHQIPQNSKYDKIEDLIN